MSVSPNELLSLADAVLNGATTEAEWRNAVGRAYYAVYHAAKAFHESLPAPGKIPSSPTGVHEELAFRLSWPKIPESDARFTKSRDLGRKLRWLSMKRVLADYHLSSSFTRDDAIEVLERAREAIALA